MNTKLFLTTVLFACSSYATAEGVDLGKFQWSGDVRYRLVNEKEGDNDPHIFHQLRARLGVKAEVNESVDAVLRLATATSAVSGNQKLGDKSAPGMVRRGFGLDLGYINWKFTDGGQVWVGRTANPFYSPGKVQTIFDSDLAFEGLAVKWEKAFDAMSLFINLSGDIISENYDSGSGTDQPDTGLLGAELGSIFKGDAWAWTLRAGFYDYTNIEGKSLTVVDSGATTSAKGNSVSGSTYTIGYQLAALGTEFKYKVNEWDTSAYAEFVSNTVATIAKGRRAFEVGVVGKNKMWTLGLAYVSKERDAVLAAFTDSDSGGGGTDIRSTKITLGANVAKNTQVMINHFIAKRGVDSNNDHDESLTLADLMVSF